MQPVEGVGHRIVGRDPVGEQRHHKHDEDDQCPGGAEGIAA
jgi:hypothetical protein